MAFTSDETYLKFLQGINRNSTEFNIICDKGRFVFLVNKAANDWALGTIKENKGSVLIEHVQDLVEEKELINPVDRGEYSEFDFNIEYYETIGGYCLAEKNSCQNKVRLREVKNQDKQLLYIDSSNEPSFEFEWSYYTVQKNKLRVYKKDFNILSTNIEYYAIIPRFDIEGYSDLNDNPSQNKPFKLSDDIVNEILDLAVLDFQRINENQIGFQLSKERIT